MPRYNNSFITVRTYDTSVPLVGRIQDSRKPRQTEIDALVRMAFGDAIPATNRAAELYDPECIKCSFCGCKKHYLLFDRCAGNTWRFSRSYECKQCRKVQRLNRPPDHLPRWKRKAV